MTYTHAYLFYFFVTFSVGLFAAAIIGVTLLKTRKPFLFSYAAFHLSSSLVVMAEMFLAYIHANIHTSSPGAAVPLLNGLNTLGIHLLIITIPVVTHALTDRSHQAIRAFVFTGIALLAFLLSKIAAIVEGLSLENLEAFILFPVILYSILVCFRSHKQVQDAIQQQSARIWMLLFIGSLPMLFEELMFGYFPGISLYPIVYCAFSLVLSYHFTMRYLLPSQESAEKTRHLSDDSNVHPAGSDDPVSLESLCEQYSISPREHDVLRLAVQGHSNAQIAEALYISVGTVKSHLNKIYQKIGIKRRYELLTRFRHIPLPPASSSSEE